MCKGEEKQNEPSQLLFLMTFQLNWIETIVLFLAALRICCKMHLGRFISSKVGFRKGKKRQWLWSDGLDFAPGDHRYLEWNAGLLQHRKRAKTLFQASLLLYNDFSLLFIKVILKQETIKETHKAHIISTNKQNSPS